MAFWDRFKKKKENIDTDEIIETIEDQEEKEELKKDSETLEEQNKMEETIPEAGLENQEAAANETLEEIQEEEEHSEGEIVEEDHEEKSLSFLDRLKNGLTKTRSNIAEKIDDILASTRSVDEDMMEELEDTLISADLGMESTMEIIDQLRDRIKRKNIKDPETVKKELISIMKNELTKNNLDSEIHIENSPMIILVVGVNGVGKTTTIGKMAYQYKEKGKNVLLVAADTFRAAAIEQLTEWANRAEVDIISHKEGADPASVIFDGIAAAKNKNSDIIICDTAGRLHNKKNLMNELNKIHRVIEKEFPMAKKEVLLVLDGTTGQNAIFQAKEFKEACELTGIVITKMDGTAKGGVIFPLQAQMEIPVKLIGIGEQIDNLVEFDSEAFVEAIVN